MPQKSQRHMMDEASRRIAEVNETFLELLPTMRRKELEKLIEKRPALWGRFAGYLTSGHVFADDQPAKTHHHATKKSPAQLNREIAEALSQRKTPLRAQLSQRKTPLRAQRGSSHARKAPALTEASAGFAIHTDHEDVVADNAREHFGPDYGDAADRAKQMKAGLVDGKGKITDRGWEQLNKDIRTLEGNALSWLRKIFGRASDQGHDSYGDLIGGTSFNPRNATQAHNIVMGKNERVDFSDASYGDFARRGAWKGISDFGQSVLGGQITFFDIDPGALEIAEETADKAAQRRAAARKR